MSSARAILLVMGVAGIAAVWVLSYVSKRYEYVAAGVMPLEARSFDRASLVTAGSGGTFENPQRLGPASIVGSGTELVLVDAGRAVTEALRAARIPPSQPATLLLTSLMGENVAGLDDLLLVRSLDPEAATLRVLGPPGTRRLVEGVLATHAPALGANAEGFGPGADPVAEATDLEGGWDERVGAFRLRAAPLPGGPLPALAWRIDLGERGVLLASAGWAPEALVELGRGARVFVHEAVYGEALDAAIEQGALRPEALQREGAWHTRLEDVGGIAQRMGVRTLVLTRLRPPPVFDFQYTGPVGESFQGRVVIAADGSLVEL